MHHTSLHRTVAATAAALAMIVAGGCTPDSSPTPGSTTTTVPPVVARPVVTPSTVQAGSFITIAAPNGECDLQGGSSPYTTYTQLLGGVSVPRTGEVVVYSSQYIGSPFSGYTGNDSIIRLRIPPATAAGTYYAQLTCQAYNTSYAFAPATLIVTE